MVVSEDCHGTALHKGLEIGHGSELRTLNIFTLAFASNTTTDYVNRLLPNIPVLCSCDDSQPSGLKVSERAVVHIATS